MILSAWIKASRVPSNAFILFPLLLGASLFKAQQNVISCPLLAMAVLFGIGVQLYIVYANDYADAENDKLNKTFTPFSGGSRVLVDGELSRKQIGAAAIAALLFLVTIGILLYFQGRPLALIFVLLSLFLLWAYSYGPIKLSYRGGGELLQMAGVGGLLPLFGYYIQSGSIGLFPLKYLLVLLPLNLACSVSTTLPDAPSDAIGNKRTFSVISGIGNAKIAVIVLYVAAIFLYIAFIGNSLPQPRSIGVTVLPLLSAAGLVKSGYKALPGNSDMLYFVICSIVLTVSFTAGIALERLTAFAR